MSTTTKNEARFRLMVAIERAREEWRRTRPSAANFRIHLDRALLVDGAGLGEDEFGRLCPATSRPRVAEILTTLDRDDPAEAPLRAWAEEGLRLADEEFETLFAETQRALAAMARDPRGTARERAAAARAEWAPAATAPEGSTGPASRPSFQKIDWRLLTPDMKQQRLEHVLAIVRAAESAGALPPSWRALALDAGTDARTLRGYPELAEAVADAEHVAHEAARARLHPSAARQKAANRARRES